MTPPQETCWTLIRDVRDGSRDARTRFTGRYLDSVRGYFVARWKGTPLSGEVDDAVQEVFLDCFKEGGVLEALERANQIATRDSGGAAPHQEWHLKEERFLVQRGEDARAIIEGRAQPANAEETLTVARIAAAEQRHVASARLYANAFGLEPAWLDDMASRHRANAACEAAQAGAGRGKDAEGMSEEFRREALREALAWLRGDLDAIRRLSSPETRESLRFLLSDDSLACVRDEAALAKLPEPEREAFQQLWSAAALLEK